MPLFRHKLWALPDLHYWAAAFNKYLGCFGGGMSTYNLQVMLNELWFTTSQKKTWLLRGKFVWFPFLFPGCSWWFILRVKVCKTKEKQRDPLTIYRSIFHPTPLLLNSPHNTPVIGEGNKKTKQYEKHHLRIADL